jgi:hypothetical protein
VINPTLFYTTDDAVKNLKTTERQCYVENEVRHSDQGGYSQNLLCIFVKISVTLGLNILCFFKTESAFSKQISLVVDIAYIISTKIPIFDVKLVLKSRLKL